MKKSASNNSNKSPKTNKQQSILMEDDDKKTSKNTDTSVLDEKDHTSLTEDDLLSDIEVPMEEVKRHIVDPLIECEPIVKEYSKPNVIGDIDNAPEIPEEIIERATVNLNEDTSSFVKDDSELFGSSNKNFDKDEPFNIDRNQQQQKPNQKAEKEPPTIGNPDLDGVGRKQKMESAKHLAETCVDGYEMAHHITLGFLMKTDEKLMKQALKGKIELDAIDSEIQIGNKVYQIRKLLYDYNMNLQQILTVSPEFREQVIPLLQEEFARKNIGMTPMQRILALLVKDLQPKFVQVTQLAGTMNDVLKQQTNILRQQKSEVDRQRANTQKVDEPIIIEHNHYEPEEVK